MKPYTYLSETGAVLRVDFAGHVAMLKVTGKNGGEAWVPVGPLEIPAITSAMYQACGQRPPVILDCPETRDEYRAMPGSALKVSRNGTLVRVEWDVACGVASNLPPGNARQFGAAIIALADEAEAEPDPADVDELAVLLMDALNPGTTGIGGARPLARAILAAGYRRGARNG